MAIRRRLRPAFTQQVLLRYRWCRFYLMLQICEAVGFVRLSVGTRRGIGRGADCGEWRREMPHKQYCTAANIGQPTQDSYRPR